jgi:hypothetical protein
MIQINIDKEKYKENVRKKSNIKFEQNSWKKIDHHHWRIRIVQIPWAIEFIEWIFERKKVFTSTSNNGKHVRPSTTDRICIQQFRDLNRIKECKKYNQDIE